MPVFVWILGGLTLLVVLFFAMRVRLVVQYDKDDLTVLARAGFLRIKLYPRPEKPKDAKKKKEKPPKAPKDKLNIGGAVQKFRAGLSIISPIFGEIRRRLTISELTLHYTASTQDAAQTALIYGAANIAVANFLPLIRHHFRVKRQDVQISADFESGADRVFLRVKLSISVWGAMCLGLFVLKKLRESGLIQRGETRHGQASHQ